MAVQLYRPPSPADLLIGEITDIEDEATGNPRYTVSLTDVTHPVPLEVFAWAASERYYPSSVQQFDVGDSVLVQDIAGVLTILRPAVQETDVNEPSDIHTGRSQVYIDETTIEMKASAGEVRVSPAGAAVSGVSGATQTPALLHLRGDDMTLHGAEYGIRTLTAGAASAAGVPDNVLLLGGNQPSTPYFSIPVREHGDTAPVINLPAWPHEHTLPDTVGGGSTTGLTGFQSRRIDLSRLFPQWTTGVFVDQSAVNLVAPPPMPGQPPPTPPPSPSPAPTLPAIEITDLQYVVDFNRTQYADVSERFVIATAVTQPPGVSPYSPSPGDRLAAYFMEYTYEVPSGSLTASTPIALFPSDALADITRTPEQTLPFQQTGGILNTFTGRNRLPPSLRHFFKPLVPNFGNSRVVNSDTDQILVGYAEFQYLRGFTTSLLFSRIGDLTLQPGQASFGASWDALPADLFPAGMYGTTPLPTSQIITWLNRSTPFTNQFSLRTRYMYVRFLNAAGDPVTQLSPYRFVSATVTHRLLPGQYGGFTGYNVLVDR